MEEKEIHIEFEIDGKKKSVRDRNVKTLLVSFLTEIEKLYNSNEQVKDGVDYLSINKSVLKSKRQIFGVVEEIYRADKLSLSENLLKGPHGYKIKAEVKTSKNNFLFATTAATRENTLDTITIISEKLVNTIVALNIYINDKQIIKHNNEVNVSDTNESIYFNKIIFGPTGTGKSFLSNNYSKILNPNDENILRVTFHPEYSYFDFVGQYKPVVYNLTGTTTEAYSLYNEHSKITMNNSLVTYSFVPGIFLEAIIKANANHENNIVLIIEEINRGNCAAIFGDILQLLDRDENGNSNYELTLNADMKRFLIDLYNSAKVNGSSSIMKNITNDEIKQSISDFLNKGRIFIPQNLRLIATMNTSDQSLFPMDSAFKRRWDMEYVHINYKDVAISDVVIEGVVNEKWKDVLELVNDIIYNELNSEDKQIGQWFIKYQIKGDKKIITEKDFKNKLISYLYFDVFKHSPEIFDSPYSALVNKSISTILTQLKKHKK